MEVPWENQHVDTHFIEFQRLGRKGAASNTTRVSEVTAFVPAPTSWQGENKEKVTKRNLPSPPPERKEKDLDFPHFKCPGL